MNELIEEIKKISNLSELSNINLIDQNILFLAIVKARRYDLLANVNININNNETLTELIDYLLSNTDIVYDMRRNGFLFSQETLNNIFKIMYQKYKGTYKFEDFFNHFFESKESLNSFVGDNEQILRNYLNENNQSIPYALEESENFVKLILEEKRVDLIGKLEIYSISNLKQLVQLLNKGLELPYYLANDRFAQHLLNSKESLTSSELSILLNLLKERDCYDRKNRNSEESFFDELLANNIEYLISIVSESELVPKCLIESTKFRDECIKRNRFDLAVQCILPANIIENDDLINAYCIELNILPKEFYERGKWLLDYYQKNNNIFNSVLGTSLKDAIFNIQKEHYERFINDIEIQIDIANLNSKEIAIFSKILNLYNYKEYEIPSMVVNIIKNISDYKELVNSIEIELLSEQDIKSLVNIFQLPNNEFKINNISDIHKYNDIKKIYIEQNYNSNDLNINKENLLKFIFNINLKEAKYINSKYCYDNDENNMLDSLKNSELPDEVYNYLLLINKIVECNNLSEMSNLYINSKEITIYNLEIPFETYLRSQYTNLYSKGLYKIDERTQINGPQDSILNEVSYNGNNVKLCVPQANFNFFVHCVGSCSLASDVIDKNYKNDWLDRPQLQDHFLACSYINQKGIYSVRSERSIIFGFDSLEGGAILGMGNTDIDSIGRYSKAYNGSRELQEGNGRRARFFIPSHILKTINNGYNEIVVERRNADKTKDTQIKRKPDYIIMMAESMETNNFNCLDTLYQNQLSFVLDEDKKEIQKIGNPRNLKQYLVKYKNIIYQNANAQGITANEMANIYVDLIMKSKYYEDCLKAATEFDIPLVVVDRTYYFNKLLYESLMYDEETMKIISEYYSKTTDSQKKQMFNMVAKQQDITSLLEQQKIGTSKISP